MKNLLASLRTNEDGARTKAIIGITVVAASVGLAIYVTQKNAATPLILVVEEAAEALSDATPVEL